MNQINLNLWRIASMWKAVCIVICMCLQYVLLYSVFLDRWNKNLWIFAIGCNCPSYLPWIWYLGYYSLHFELSDHMYMFSRLLKTIMYTFLTPVQNCFVIDFLIRFLLIFYVMIGFFEHVILNIWTQRYFKLYTVVIAWILNVVRNSMVVVVELTTVLWYIFYPIITCIQESIKTLGTWEKYSSCTFLLTCTNLIIWQHTFRHLTLLNRNINVYFCNNSSNVLTIVFWETSYKFS